MLLIILKPSCSSAIPIEYILCNVPDIQIVPFGFSTFLHNLIHFLLNLCFSSTLVPLSESLSHEPLFTETIFPPWQVIPSLLKKYGGSANIISTDSGFIFVRILKESPNTNCDSSVSKYNGTFFVNKFSIISTPLIIAYNYFFTDSITCIRINHTLYTYYIYLVAFVPIQLIYQICIVIREHTIATSGS